jgi:hypothetical protein
MSTLSVRQREPARYGDCESAGPGFENLTVHVGAYFFRLLGSRPSFTWTSPRCGRYKYQKVLVHTTNPDYLVPSTPSVTDVPPLQVTPG